MGITIPRPPPMGGRGNNVVLYGRWGYLYPLSSRWKPWAVSFEAIGLRPRASNETAQGFQRDDKGYKYPQRPTKHLSVTVYRYVICMPSFIMIGWEMAEILHFEILRKHGQTHKQTHKHTNKQTDRHGHYNTSPSPYGGRGNNVVLYGRWGYLYPLSSRWKPWAVSFEAIGLRPRASNETAQGFQRDDKGYKYPQRPTKPRYCYIWHSNWWPRVRALSIIGDQCLNQIDESVCKIHYSQ